MGEGMGPSRGEGREARMNPRDWMGQDPPPYLPDFMRDFHDAKGVFKTIDQWAEKSDMVKDLSWVTAQVFTVDYFLWFCGVHGYTLQKCRKKGVEFEDMGATLAKFHKLRSQAFAKMFDAMSARSAPESPRGSIPESPSEAGTLPPSTPTPNGGPTK